LTHLFITLRRRAPDTGYTTMYGGGYGRPPPQQYGYGQPQYGAPPPQQYGYPPQQQYGAPPPPQYGQGAYGYGGMPRSRRRSRQVRSKT